MTNANPSTPAVLSEAQIREIIFDGLPPESFKGKRILALTPDTTRTCPLPQIIGLLNQILAPSCERLDFMVALGTHTPLSREKLLDLYGIEASEAETRFPKSSFFNHRWDLPESFRSIGMIDKNDIERISGGELNESLPVEINKAVFDYDELLILGPVFPHEVVGFSGGYKYLFPGISGGAFLHFFHWLGAVLTCKRIIGVKDTPVRDLINKAMALVPIPTRCLAMVVNPDETLCGLFAGDTQNVWSQAADLSAGTHIRYRDRSYNTVLGIAPEMYDEIWTGGKVMYKLEQMVAPGGRLIIYAPHIREISRTWGKDIEAIGYHTKDYFLARMERFEGIPKGVLAHSTHVKGTGSYKDGVETPDVQVILATSIPEDTCERINLGYLDPGTINPDDFRKREEEGILVVDHAGEILYKLAT